jgi:hypothetical protein
MPGAQRKLQLPRRSTNARSVLPVGLIHRCQPKQYAFHPLGDEVNAIKESHPNI